MDGEKPQPYLLSLNSLRSLFGGAATAAAKADSAGDETRNQQDHTHGDHDLGLQLEIFRLEDPKL